MRETALFLSVDREDLDGAARRASRIRERRPRAFFFILYFTRRQLKVQRGRVQNKDNIKDRLTQQVERFFYLVLYSETINSTTGESSKEG